MVRDQANMRACSRKFRLRQNEGGKLFVILKGKRREADRNLVFHEFDRKETLEFEIEEKFELRKLQFEMRMKEPT